MSRKKQIFDTKKQLNDFQSFLMQYVKGAFVEYVFYDRTQKKHIIFWEEPER